MTITYTGRVANARLCAFSCLLFHWKGSIYKLMYKEMAIFCTLYAAISAIYRLTLDSDQKRTFEKIALYCETFINLIPLSFVLGFYVALVVTRWWNQYNSIPWPDRVMIYASTMIEGNDEHGRLIRRTLMRYLTLGSLIVFQATSVRVKKRFPTFDHLIEAGIASRAEIQALDEVNTPHGKWWIPFVWCCNLVKYARKQGRIADNYLLKSLIDEISAYRGNLGMLYSYDWISVPLVYTQVTTLAVYTFFLGCVFGRQYLDPLQGYTGHNIDLYIPFFTLLQFFFYMGWLKVAEQLINPFGEDDDDFEMNWIIDRNLQVSLLTTDDLYGQMPPLEKDLYFGEPPPDYLPYTKSSIKGMSQPHMGSTVDIRVSDEGMKVLSPLETIQEGVATGNATYISSYLNTPRRNTPMASPHLGHNQNLMSGMLSPTEIRSRMSLHSFDKESEDCSSSTTAGHSVVSRATEKLGKWLIDHSSRTDLTHSLHSTFMGIVSRQTSAGDDVEHYADPMSLLGKDAQVSDGKIGIPSTQSCSKLSPVAELFTSDESVQNSAVLIELNPCDVDERLDATRVTSGNVFDCEATARIVDSTAGLVSELCQNLSLEQSSDLNPAEPACLDGGICVTVLNPVEMQGSANVQTIKGGLTEEGGVNSTEKHDFKNRITVTHVTEESWPLTILGEASDSVQPQLIHGGFNESSPIRWTPHGESGSALQNPVLSLSAHFRDRHCSDSSTEYEMPESNQCTVSSLTPLLTSEVLSSHFQGFDPPVVDVSKTMSAVNVTSVV